MMCKNGNKDVGFFIFLVVFYSQVGKNLKKEKKEEIKKLDLLETKAEVTAVLHITVIVEEIEEIVILDQGRFETCKSDPRRKLDLRYGKFGENFKQKKIHINDPPLC